ncbi:MAG: hypothetical protein U0174_12660 [Polyangiaceae bacterium]
MRSIDFFSLSRTVQDRILGGIDGRFPPEPLVRLKAPASHPFHFFGMAFFGLVSLVVVQRLGYGSFESNLARQSAPFIAVYSLSAFCLFGGLVLAAAHYVRLARLPFPRGIYVYPARVLDARKHPIVDHPLTELVSANFRPDGLALTFQGGRTFVFPHASVPQGEAIVPELARAQQRAHEAAMGSDPNAVLAFDPLHEPRFANPVGPGDPLLYDLPGWVKVGWLYGLLGALAFGPVLWVARNFVSDGSAYRSAKAVATPSAFRDYLSHGSRYRTEVEGELLPRAELAEAVKEGSVDAILAFEKTHERSKIQPEIDAAKSKAYRDAFERARAKGTLAALREFEAKYPKHGLKKDMASAVHELFAAAAERYAPLPDGGAPNRPGPAKDAVSFLRSAIAFVETHGGDVDLRVRRKSSPTLGRVEKALARMPEYMGEMSRPARYFDDAHEGPRDKQLLDELSTLLGGHVPAEFLGFRPVAEPIAMDAKLPDVTKPTIFITVMTEWSGHTVPTKKPRGVFVGLYLHYDVDLVLPGGTSSHHRHVVYRPVPSSKLKEYETAPRTNPPLEELIYESMVVEGRKQFLAKADTLFFAPSPK